MDAYRRAVTNYLVVLGAACLICGIYIDLSALLLIWGFAAVGLHLLGKALSKQ